MLPLPFPSGTISLNYGETSKPYSRDNPHQGIDFSRRASGVVAGAVIRASGRGTVLRSGWEPGEKSPTYDRPNKWAGNSIDVLYPGVMVRYMHRPSVYRGPQRDDVVVAGSELGLIGDTGFVTGAHLHMETWDPRTRTRVSPWRFFTGTASVGDGSPAGGDGKPFDPEEDDMYSDEDRARDIRIETELMNAKAGIWSGGSVLIDGVVQKFNYGVLPIVVNNQKLIAAQAGSIAGLRSLLEQVLSRLDGTPDEFVIDFDAIEAAAERGAEKSFDEDDMRAVAALVVEDVVKALPPGSSLTAADISDELAKRLGA